MGEDHRGSGGAARLIGSGNRRGRLRAALAALLVGMVGVVMLPAAPASAVSTVSVVVSIVDPNTGAPVSQVHAASGQMPVYGVKVAYSCNADNCTNTRVTLAATPTDPYGFGKRKEVAAALTPPPITPTPVMTGTYDTGLTIPLGNLANGSSSSFIVRYTVNAGPTNVSSGSYFPNGSEITPSVTINADNAVAAGTGSATATWYSEIIGPSIGLDVSTPSSRTDQPVRLTVVSAANCTGTAGRGIPYRLCAKSHNAVVQLPTNAVYVASSGSGTYDPGTHRVTFTSTDIATLGTQTIDVTFPSANYPTTGSGCIVNESFTSTIAVTYLNDTVENATSAARSIEIHNCTPFARATIEDKLVSPVDAGTTTNPIMYIPNAGAGNKVGGWQVWVRNGGNVPGQATVVDNALDQPGMPVNRIRTAGETSGTSTISYRLDNGTTGTANAPYTAPVGRRIVAATVVSGTLAPQNALPSDTGSTLFRVFYDLTVAPGVTPGVRTNTATASMAYPGTALTPIALGPETRTIDLQPTPPPVAGAPIITAVNWSNDISGTDVIVGREVTWSISETIRNIPAGTSFVPQYVFLAPVGWDIKPNGVTFEATAPANISVQYKTVTYQGVTRNAVVATWPSAVALPPINTNQGLPKMYIKTIPTVAAPAGTNNNIAHYFTGDANHSLTQAQATYGGLHVDATDFDGDGVTTEPYSSTTWQSSLAPSSGIGVSKEICRPDASPDDGCEWLSDPSIKVGVPPNATSIKYRVTIRNAGNTALSNVVAYDVLPYIGDTGTSAALATQPRGSTVQERLASVSGVPAGVTLSYSTSTNPPRPEVNNLPGQTGTWTTTVANASAIKVQIATLPFGESRTFTYEASLVNGSANQIACNSIAAAATGLATVEPSPVCAATQEADFSLDPATRYPLQEGRSGIVPFVVNQGGGSPSASGTVTIAVPAGVAFVNFTAIPGWSCAAPSTAGPVTVTCTPVNPDSTTRSLPINVPETIPLRVTPAAGTAGTQLCFDGVVTGALYDPEPDNNDEQVCSLVTAPPTTGITITKDDGRTLVSVDDQYTYTINVANELTAEAVSGVVLTDSLPAGVTYISSTPAGTQGPAGTLTWNLPNLTPVGVTNIAGNGTTGGAAPTQTITVTVRVAPSAAGTLTNVASVTAPDPAGGATLSDQDDDVDTVQDAGLELTKQADKATVTTIGETITYTLELANPGNVPLTDVQIADPMPGLSPFTCDAGPLPLTLAAGDDTECTATYQVTVNDFLAGRIVNRATASGQPPQGPRVVSPEASAPVAAPARATLTIDKTTPPGSNFDAAGDVLTFGFTVTNTGNVPLTGLVVSDQLPGTGPVVCDTETLAPAGVATCSTTYSATSIDVDAGGVTNTATATATAPGGPITSAPDTVTVPSVRTATITLDKSALETTFADPDTTLHYTFRVTNTGTVTLTGVTVNDPLPGLSAIDCGDVTTLAAGASITCTATYTTTQGDIDADGVTNTATVTATPPTGVTPPPPATDSVDVDAAQTAAISIDKTVDGQQLTAAGQVLTYTFVVSNPGNVTLTGVTVNDALPGLSTINCNGVTTLDPDTTMTCTATYQITQQNIDNADQLINSATATGQPPSGPAITSLPDSAPVPPVQAPSVTVDKTSVENGFDEAGDVLHFSFYVENTGNMTLDNLVINDPLPGISPIACPLRTLPPGGNTTCTATYTTTQADVDNGGITNTATAATTTPSGRPVTSAVDTLVIPAARDLDVTFDKTSPLQTYSAAGQTIPFNFAVRNTGNVTILSFDVTDELPGVSTVTCDKTMLAPEATALCNATYQVTQADLDDGELANDATLKVTGPPGTTRAPLPDSVLLSADQQPGISITKRALQASFAAAGTTIQYEFEVRNTGNVTLTGVTVSDPLPGISVDLCPDTELAPTDTVVCTGTYTTTQTDMDDGDVINTAAVEAEDPNGNPVSGESNEVVVDALQNASVTLVKEPDKTTYAAAGEVITYTFTIENTGNLTLTGVTLTDALLGITEGECGAATVLAPTEQTECTATYTVTPADLDAGSIVNEATADATASTGPVEGPATATINAVQDPGITIDKTVDETTYDAVGDVLHYSFTVTNTGNVTLTDITVTDDLAGVSAPDCPSTTLAPGAVPMVCTATYTVTQHDVDTGSIANTAHVSATPPGVEAQPVTDDAAVTTAGTQTAAIALVKSAAEASFASVGEVIHYTFHVTNTGNVTLIDVNVTDPLPGLSAIQCPDTELGPGDSVDCTATYSTTQADLDRGHVTNVAIASGLPGAATDGSDVVALALPVVASAESTVTVPAIQTPGVTLLKAVEETSFAAGSTLHFRFTVTNTGNVTIEELAINDPMAGLSAIGCPTTTLAPSESTTCTATYVATQADVTAGKIVNTATATGSTLNAAGLASEPSTVEVAAVVTPPPPPPTTPPPPTAPETGELPATGGGNLPRTIGLAAALLLAGLAVVEIARRRRRSA